MSNYYASQKRGTGKYLFFLIVGMILAGIIYIYTSERFERNKPVITISKSMHWNLHDAIPLKLNDDTGIKSYKVYLEQEGQRVVLLKDQLLTPVKELNLEIKYPKSRRHNKEKSAKIIVETSDISYWNVLEGNSATSTTDIIIDKRKPLVNVINKSYKIAHGGSALVTFEARDENMQDLYIISDKGRRFEVTPFYKENFYIALIAWPVKERSFRAYIMAKDKAGNFTKTYIPYFLKTRHYKKSKIPVSDKFLDGKIDTLSYEYYDQTVNEEAVEYNALSRTDKFRFVNEQLRNTNEERIREIVKYKPDVEPLSSFHVNPFLPLKNSAKVGSFGDHRHYNYKKSKISEAYHLGLDLASVRADKIKLSNGGRVLYTGSNGIYGNMPIVDHGLGLTSLYAHCSAINVSEGEIVGRGTYIANTGSTGLALGDHLHFTLMVQGEMVRPQEWMDRNWINDNITKIIAEAKKIIKANGQ
jgi:murein DD-endopeptidase MepM/ murein hydrolase activator NlpD